MRIIIFLLILLILHYLINRIEKFTLTNQEDIKILYQMLYDTDKILTKNNISYYIDGGTLLGAIRHKGIIPWDDDGDICILKEEEKKFLNLKLQFLDIGYKIEEYWGGYKIFPVNGKIIQHKNSNWRWYYNDGKVRDIEKQSYKFPFIDVSIISKQNASGMSGPLDKYHYNDIVVKNHWPKCFHYEKDLFNLKRYDFNGFTLVGPHNPNPYLERCYGKDWDTIGKQQYDHLNMTFLNNEITDINQLYKPACPNFNVTGIATTAYTPAYVLKKNHLESVKN